MELLDEIMAFNQHFVEHKKYEEYQTTKYPDKKMVVLSCMDTRLLELLPKAMDFRNGDVKIIKNAGAVITHPFDSVMRSLIVAVYELQAEEVYVVGHYECGMSGVNANKLIYKFIEKGITEEILLTLEHSGIDLLNWLKGFGDVKENVKHSVSIIKNHPLLPENTPVHGLVMCPNTGKLDLIISGYEGQ